jgi:hypothetical protein
LNFTHGDAGCEGPVDAGGADLERRRLADPTRELRVPVRSTKHKGDSTVTWPNGCSITRTTRSDQRVPGGAEADVVWEHCGAVDVVVAVDGVGAVEDGDAEAGGERVALHAVDHGGPVGGRGLLARRAPAGVEDAAGAELRKGARRRDGALDLGHLRRLLPQRHAAQQVPHPRLHRRRRVPVQRRRHRAGEAAAEESCEAEQTGTRRGRRGADWIGRTRGFVMSGRPSPRPTWVLPLGNRQRLRDPPGAIDLALVDPNRQDKRQHNTCAFSAAAATPTTM